MISIIIPLYNRAHLIGETLDSIINQTYKNWECIVVDDGSTDNSVDVVSAFAKANPKIAILQRPTSLPKGANACRNYGLQQARGEYVLFYDSDDVMLPQKLQWHMDGFNEYPTIDGFVLNSYYYNFETKNPYLPWREKLYTDQLLQDYILQIAGWQTGDMLWRTEALKDIHFDEKLYSSQDYEFYTRALICNKKFKFNNLRASHIRHTKGSIKNNRSTKKLTSDLYARVSIVNQLFENDLMTQVIARNLIEEHYKLIEQLAYNNQLSLLKTPINSLYKLANFLNEKNTFFKKLLIGYPIKVVKKLFS